MAWFSTKHALSLPTPDRALPGRPERMPIPELHHVLLTPLAPPFPPEMELALFGMGCFWQRKGIYSTAVGYAGGSTPNPTYEEVCSGLTGHAEVVQVVFEPVLVSYDALLRIFWESHDPTQGMPQGNDVGTQYRSAVYCHGAAQHAAADASRRAYQAALSAARRDKITTEIAAAPEFYYAEEYHQQYLAKNPRGYCGLGGTGVSCPAPSPRTP